MNVATLLSLFRSDVRDEAVPYLWSDVEIWSYIDEAQKMFCRLQGGIADAYSGVAGVTRLTVAAASQRVALSPKVLEIRSARSVPEGRAIAVLNREDSLFRLATDDYGSNVGSTLAVRSGPVRALLLGEAKGFVRALDVPTEQTVVDLAVLRLPLGTIDSSNAVLEVDETHHRYLMYWMKYLAHQKQDAETFDRGRAGENRVLFEEYCELAKGETARLETPRRAISYGGY